MSQDEPFGALQSGDGGLVWTGWSPEESASKLIERYPGTRYTLVEKKENEALEDLLERVADSARVVFLDRKTCTVGLWKEWELALELTFSEFEIQPMFSGACWAGTVVWPASILLCDYMKEMVSFREETRVIELGAGLAVPGMAAKLLGAGTVVLTEQEPLPALIEKNLQGNAKVFEGAKGGSPKVALFDWYDPNDALFSGPAFDYILVSDCVYQELYGDSWKDLADCIARLSKPGHTVTLNSIERRKKDGVDEFLAYCMSLGIQWELIRSFTGPMNEQLQLYKMWN